MLNLQSNMLFKTRFPKSELIYREIYDDVTWSTAAQL